MISTFHTPFCDRHLRNSCEQNAWRQKITAHTGDYSKVQSYLRFIEDLYQSRDRSSGTLRKVTPKKSSENISLTNQAESSTEEGVHLTTLASGPNSDGVSSPGTDNLENIMHYLEH